jgi:hypothetical protein
MSETTDGTQAHLLKEGETAGINSKHFHLNLWSLIHNGYPAIVLSNYILPEILQTCKKSTSHNCIPNPNLKVM